VKTRLLGALVGLAIGFALPTFAQPTNTPDPQLGRQYVTLLKKFDEAFNKGDAAALAALYTEDAVLVTDTGPVHGREAIEKHYADEFQNVHFNDLLTTVDEDSPGDVEKRKYPATARL
jgi:SnoaL-like protein